MRQTMRPVSLSRVVETADFAGKIGKFSSKDLAEFLKSSLSRGKEIAEESVNIGILAKEDDLYVPTKLCSIFLVTLRKNDWKAIHEIMMDYSFYRIFFEILQSIEPGNSGRDSYSPRKISNPL